MTPERHRQAKIVNYGYRVNTVLIWAASLTNVSFSGDLLHELSVFVCSVMIGKIK